MYTLNYSEASKYIENADILLFRSGKFPSIGWFISKYTGGNYSHIGLAHWSDKILECVEQREFRGGRSVNLATQVKHNPNRIDVYRLSPQYTKINIEYPIERDKNILLSYEEIVLSNEVKRDIIDTAKEITGQEYGWKNILDIFIGYVPFFRLLRHYKNGDDEVTKAYVCSTLVAYAIRKNYIDLVPHISDRRTTPVDISRSNLVNYLFTIGTL